MAEQQVWVGLDLGLRRTHVCIVDCNGLPVHEENCETSLAALTIALSRFALHEIGMIAVEAAGETHIVRKLRDAAFPIAMFESRKASKFLAMRRNKTDASDARGLADLARLGRNTVSQVYLKSRECERLRSKIVMRKRLVQLRVAADGALRSRLRLHGLQLKSTSAPGRLRHQVEGHITHVRADEHMDLTAELAPLVELCEALRSYQVQLDREVAAAAAADPVCRLLMEVPGVGPVCALSFRTAIEDPARFRRSADVAAYLGLIPRRYQSGETSRALGITKTGSKLTRTHLVTAATVFGTRAPDCELKRWFLSLRERIGSKRARVALARKLSIVLLAMWKRGRHFDVSVRSALPSTAPAQ